ncbi:O(6)-alkylguanine repair protein YbaZ [Sinobacterium caligoides]|uniref:O(6)-alkylguanine repair protein YbaZ n=1 Tax=Sinobacterium caligoides TaxID=933926 RepID=A0A3N2E0T5_9GAMM|nr:MGMT family protein [Sinobacterium caligoides]ROS05647.1 O(6)-alkylguanine repair protein YbaZ [Sinobacterium caligoides]
MNTQYRQQILSTVAAIPRGFVSSYGDIARLAGLPNQARLVGYVLKTLPEESRIPWHRVINAQGKISFPCDSLSYHRQRLALEEEGLIVKNNKVQWLKKRWAAQ